MVVVFIVKIFIFLNGRWFMFWVGVVVRWLGCRRCCFIIIYCWFFVIVEIFLVFRVLFGWYMGFVIKIYVLYLIYYLFVGV